MEAAGIYIHVPFCVEKCRYCDFYSQTDLTRQAAYVQSVLAELRQVPPIPADTLYLGGGTPSLLSPGDIQSLIDTAADIFSLPPNAEITLEVNPGTLDREGFTACRAAGVNRLNIGIQSFQDAHLSFLGRIHSGDQAAQAIQWAGRAGFDNIGLDLIYGLPAQTRSDWKQDLTRALSHAPEHLSCYLLTYEPQTPLGRLQQVGRVIPLNDDATANLFLMTDRVLTDAGYDHYEISNFARRPAHRSRHNTKYWRHIPYLGFGPSAHSFISPERRWNTADLVNYIHRMETGRSPVDQREILTRSQRMMETIYLGLRQTDGILLDAFEQEYSEAFQEKFFGIIEGLSAEKFLSERNGRFGLTPRGMLFHDHICTRFVTEID